MTLVYLDICCNDPDNGLFDRRARGLQLPDSLGELAATDMEGPVFSQLPRERLRFSRRIYHSKRSSVWIGNWCWNRYWFEPAVAVDLLDYAHTLGLFACEMGEERFCARWNQAQVWEARDREFVERQLVKGMLAEEARRRAA